MKYYIVINQLALSKTKLDLKDAAILDYLKAFCMADDKNVRQLEITEKQITYKYTWVNFKHLIKEMPLLKLKSKSSLSERIQKIEKAGFIKTFLAPDRNLYVRLTEKIKELEFSGGVLKNEQGVRLDEQGVRLDEHLYKHNINNIISLNKNNNIIASQSDANNSLGKEINYLIGLFKAVNPSYERLFANKTQRGAIERLLKKMGRENLEKLINTLPKIFGQPYAPRITTPLKLEEKLADLIAYLQQKSQEKKDNGVAIL